MGDLSRGWAASELFAQLPCRFFDGHRPLLEPARQAEDPDPVAEVAAKLAEDRWRGVGREPLAPLRVETIERLEQAQKRYLHQVVALLRGAAVAKGERACKRRKAPD